MLRIHKYILKRHHVENGEYSIIHLLVQVWTTFKIGKIYIIIFLKSNWMRIKYVINQHRCDKIKKYPHIDH
jgi:hypothetical protein